MAGDAEVLHETRGCAGIATLNRPAALNSLTTGMVLELRRLYVQWAADPAVHCVLLRGAGAKAFCAGGDIKAVAALAAAGRPDEATQFFLNEYRTNHSIRQLPLPHVALLDGITMGGGVGVSVHGPIRVATERTLLSMPECGIGLFPDVGGSWFLPRLTAPGVGTYLALTGGRLRGLEAKQAGMATHYIDSGLVEELIEGVCGMQRADAGSVVRLDELLRQFEARTEAPAGITPLRQRLPDIRDCFCEPTLEGVYKRLGARGDAWGDATLQLLRKGSPLSQRVTWSQLQRGAALGSLAECLAMEAGIAYRMLALPSDFCEGVRAALLDKDGRPRWRHASIEDVPASEVDAFFEPLPPGLELQLPEGQTGQARL